jgi:hypothetical protein
MHLSISEINTWLKCPELHYHKYVLRVRKPAPVAVAEGILYDRLVGELTTLHRDGRPLPSDATLKAWAQHYLGEFDVDWSQDGATPEAVVDLAVRAAALFAAEILPQLRPVEIQARFEIEFENRPWSFLGFIDLIEDGHIVVDNKLLSRSPTQADVDQDLQLTAYAAGYQWLYGRLPEKLRFDCVIKTKTLKVARIETVRTEEQIERFYRALGAWADAITSGVVFPRPAGWHCGRETCQYWQECHERW